VGFCRTLVLTKSKEMKRIIILVLIVMNHIVCTAPVVPIHFDILRTQPLRRGFIHYADDLGWRESRNNYKIINKIGCFGEHQWKEATLHLLGYRDISLRKFKVNPMIFPPSAQLQALRSLVDLNKTMLKPYECYIGTVIDGIPVTESGLLAAVHLGGMTAVSKYLLSWGTYILIDGHRLDIYHAKKQKQYNSHDIFGTSIATYLKEFQNYDL
jgi:hypothetical protein